MTGSAGFVGRHMVAALQARGWDVTGADPRGRDARDARDVFGTDTTVYDLVVHCAYHVGGRAAIDGQPRLLACNLVLDAGLFDWAVRTGQRRVLYFSSSAAYPVGMQSGVQPYRLHEDDADPDAAVSADLLAALGHAAPLRPDARYGWAKLTGEQLARAAGEAGLAVHVVRPFSGYGADQDPAYPFPAILARARAHTGGPFRVWGPPGQTRDWIYICDVVAAALAVVDADERRPVNLCTGVGTEFGALARMMLTALGKRAEILYDTTAPTGVAYRVGDPGRMRRLYSPTVSIQDGVRMAVAGLAGVR